MAVDPDVILMDEPCSALDPISTGAIEELMLELKLKQNFTIVIVTHNMQQAARVSDRTAFFNVDKVESGKRIGKLVEFAPRRRSSRTPTTCAPSSTSRASSGRSQPGHKAGRARGYTGG